jgi:hypothetical protein
MKEKNYFCLRNKSNNKSSNHKIDEKSIKRVVAIRYAHFLW